MLPKAPSSILIPSWRQSGWWQMGATEATNVQKLSISLPGNTPFRSAHLMRAWPGSVMAIGQIGEDMVIHCAQGSSPGPLPAGSATSLPPGSRARFRVKPLGYLVKVVVYY